jgi:hypothetical protein
MNTKLLIISLAMITSVLVACGGDARSPDRPSPRLDPDSLRIKFTNGNKLPGLGDDTAIQVQMLGSQTDGIDENLGPELNVTAGATWKIEGADLGNPAIAKLADAVRNANQIGTVQDILSKVRLLTNDSQKNLTISGSYRFNNKLYLVKPEREPFTVIPPVRSGDLMIKGPDKIYFDPLDPDPEVIVAKYTLEQGLENTKITENQTTSYRFCASKIDYFTFEDYTIYSANPPRTATAATQIDTPFNVEDKTQPYKLDIVAINLSESCADYRDPAEAGTIVPIARTEVSILPAVVSKVDVCVVVAPTTGQGNNNTCSDNATTAGLFNPAFTAQCEGLDTAAAEKTSANVPAGSKVQMVAQLNYRNPVVVDQTYPQQYRCFNDILLSWSEILPADKKSIYEVPLDTTFGNGLLIGQPKFETGLSSAVTASYKKSATESVTGNLTLNLKDDSLESIAIVPVTGNADPNGMYKIRYNLLETSKEFKTVCTYKNAGVSACGDSNVSWSISDATILKVDPTIARQTTVSPSNTTDPVDGTAKLKAQYTKNGEYAEVTIEILNNPILELHLVQAVDRNAAPLDLEKKVDEFSCLGSGSPELLNPEDPAQIGKVPGAIQFYAHALFQSGKDAAGNDTIDPTKTTYLENITTNPAVKLIAEEGYYDTATQSCVSGPILDNIDPNLSSDPAKPAGAGKPAKFNSNKKGLFEGQGVTRTGTLCVRAIIDLNGNDAYDAPTDNTPDIAKERISVQGTTVFVQPASDLALLGNSASVCDALSDPQNPLFSPLILPALYNFASYADPLIANLPTQDVLDLLNGGLAELPAP